MGRRPQYGLTRMEAAIIEGIRDHAEYRNKAAGTIRFTGDEIASLVARRLADGRTTDSLMSNGTIYRAIWSLEHLGYLVRSNSGATYRTGAQFTERDPALPIGIPVTHHSERG